MVSGREGSLMDDRLDDGGDTSVRPVRTVESRGLECREGEPVRERDGGRDLSVTLTRLFNSAI